MSARRVRMSDVLYGDIVKQINSGGFAVDQRLPSEKEFCERFSVSRPIVREALERLRTEGLIRSRQGAGSFVASGAISMAAAEMPLQASSDVMPAHINSIAAIQKFYAYRISFEGELAYAAARNRQPADIQRIGSLLQNIKSSVASNTQGIDEDLEYHEAIAQATHNEFFIAAWNASRGQIRFLIELARSLSALGSPNHSAAVRSSHEPIFECIRDGDADGARTRMREHITRSQERVFLGKWT
ncbi:transcriptional regulator, GntR family [Bradyrhizobium canariense]|uniref:Transcriptional regulator, GntR family n=2 Tax=Bradyrhizobium canariense TaxID=255045 RepID=A0A1H2BJ55_9BRAD|nr:transcriptional regulator, GntR family [Bradyrhizobium canariense]